MNNKFQKLTKYIFLSKCPKPPIFLAAGSDPCRQAGAASVGRQNSIVDGGLREEAVSSLWELGAANLYFVRREGLEFSGTNLPVPAWESAGVQDQSGSSRQLANSSLKLRLDNLLQTERDLIISKL